MIRRFGEWRWEDVPIREYKANPSGADGVVRQTLSEGTVGDFELRYFEVEPDGHTSYERHNHEHLAIVIRGQGRVLIGEEWHAIGLFDLVQIPGQTAHQFVCAGTEPFGFLCVVDRVRDRPILLADPEPAARASK